MPNTIMETLTVGGNTYDITDARIGDLADLTTTAKSTVVDAINEAAQSGSSISPYTSNPAALGTADPGSSNAYARGDHVHDFPQDFIAALLNLAEKVAYIDGNGQTYYAALEAALTHRVLSSISAVYTQSGTVYSDTSLDSLKTDLVVTATYSDSSTATVAAADYTLSGTLTAGTSTVTVSYGGKTTTFTVTVTNDVLYELQSAFTSTGSNSVDTGIKFTDNDVISLLCDATVSGFSSSITTIFSTRSESESPYFALQTQLKNSKKYTWGSGLSWDAGEGFIVDGNQLRFALIFYKTNPYSRKWAAKNVTSGIAKDGAASASSPYTNSNTIHLGKYGSYNGFSGTINSFKLLRREITDAEIADFLANGA